MYVCIYLYNTQDVILKPYFILRIKCVNCIGAKWHLFVITGEGQTSDAQWRLSSSITLHGGPVEFRPVRATPCLLFTEVRQW